MNVDTQSDDEANAVAAAQRFLAALERRDAAGLAAMLSAGWLARSGAEWAAEWGGTTSVAVRSLHIDRSRPGPPGAVNIMVTLDVTPSAQNSNWNAGKNERVIQMVKQDGSWKVAGFGG